MPKVLFIHNGASGRFTFLSKALTARGWEAAQIGPQNDAPMPNTRMLPWNYLRGTTTGIFAPAIRAEIDLIRGHEAALVARQLKAGGFTPDLIIGHPGWGEMVYLRQVFPDAPQIQIGEFFYQTGSSDFDPEFIPNDDAAHFDEVCRVWGKNAVLTLSHVDAAKIVVPTPFQRSTFPPLFSSRIEVIHEGVDTKITRRKEGAGLSLQGGRQLDRATPVVTFINRTFEPMRGFHVFMRALPRFQKAVPQAHVLMIGADAPPAYGAAPKAGGTWKAAMLAEMKDRIDLGRVHFVGVLPYKSLIHVLSLSSAHVYLTHPFVLSWSLLDAMACECAVIGSDTAPVRDALTDGETGVLVDFFDTDALADRMADLCRNQPAFAPMRRAARQAVVQQFDRDTVCLPAWMALIEKTLRERSVRH